MDSIFLKDHAFGSENFPLSMKEPWKIGYMKGEELTLSSPIHA
jgi:hypothetical protein